MARVADIKDQMADLEEKEKAVKEQLHNLLSALPNLVDDSVPDGDEEDDNVEIRSWGERTQRNDMKDHVELGETLDMMDFETAAKMSGARFTVLSSGLARLERALGQFMLDVHTQENGYTELSVPLMVREDCMYGTGQLPKFRDDQFQTTRGDWLSQSPRVV